LVVVQEGFQLFKLSEDFQVRGLPFRVCLYCDYFRIGMCKYDAYA